MKPSKKRSLFSHFVVRLLAAIGVSNSTSLVQTLDSAGTQAKRLNSKFIQISSSGEHTVCRTQIIAICMWCIWDRDGKALQADITPLTPGSAQQHKTTLDTCLPKCVRYSPYRRARLFCKCKAVKLPIFSIRNWSCFFSHRGFQWTALQVVKKNSGQVSVGKCSVVHSHIPHLARFRDRPMIYLCKASLNR